MNDTGLFLIFMLLLIPLIIGIQVWSKQRSKDLIQSWPQANGYHVIDAEERYMRRGPFFWTTAKGQTVFYVTLLDPSGYQRRAWVRCGGFWGGLFSDKVDVRWDG